MCGKMIPAEDVEVHFVMCITKPRVSYNGLFFNYCLITLNKIMFSSISF